MKSEPGTYVLILESHSTAKVQIGKWREIDVQPGYYLYVGSAFGPGGVRARVSRHLRLGKPKHWHIDFLREFTTPIGVWINYETERLEHYWALMILGMKQMTSIQGFGCSDCTCHSHLFYSEAILDTNLANMTGFTALVENPV